MHKMSVFDYFKDKTSNEKGDIVAKVKPQETFEQKVEEPDEWVWIEGYKGTDSDMTCYNNFQFELNKKYVFNGDIELCERGFHFCKTLKDVFNYYDLCNSDKPNRYFKVKALVSTKQMKAQEEEYKRKLEEYRSYSRVYRFRPTNDKFVAKEIVLTEEVSFKELLPYINFAYVETEADWNLVRKIGYEQYKRNYFINKMDGLGFGETFLNVLYDDLNGSGLYSTVKFAQALNEENVSKDMAVYLLLKHCKGN